MTPWLRSENYVKILRFSCKSLEFSTKWYTKLCILVHHHKKALALKGLKNSWCNQFSHFFSSGWSICSSEIRRNWSTFWCCSEYPGSGIWKVSSFYLSLSGANPILEMTHLVCYMFCIYFNCYQVPLWSCTSTIPASTRRQNNVVTTSF